jgi:hypothetical protein
MEKDGLLKKADGIMPHFYHLKSHKKAYNIFNYKHEKICADIYVALRPEFSDAKHYEDFERVGLKYDRQSVINGKVVFWEIDRSTMTGAKIRAKVERYIRLGKTAGQIFSVVFACSDRRAKSLINILSEFKNSKVFYTVDIKELINNPTGKVFNSPTLERVTLLLS